MKKAYDPEMNAEKKDEFFKFESVEKCALRLALKDSPEFSEIGKDQFLSEMESFHPGAPPFRQTPLITRARMNVNPSSEDFKLTPELCELYLTAATEEQAKLKKEKAQQGNLLLSCREHKIDDHLTALESLIGVFEKRNAAGTN